MNTTRLCPLFVAEIQPGHALRTTQLTRSSIHLISYWINGIYTLKSGDFTCIVTYRINTGCQLGHMIRIQTITQNRECIFRITGTVNSFSKAQEYDSRTIHRQSIVERLIHTELFDETVSGQRIVCKDSILWSRLLDSRIAAGVIQITVGSSRSLIVTTQVSLRLVQGYVWIGRCQLTIGIVSRCRNTTRGLIAFRIIITNWSWCWLAGRGWETKDVLHAGQHCTQRTVGRRRNLGNNILIFIWAKSIAVSTVCRHKGYMRRIITCCIKSP